MYNNVLTIYIPIKPFQGYEQYTEDEVKSRRGIRPMTPFKWYFEYVGGRTKQDCLIHVNHLHAIRSCSLCCKYEINLKSIIK